VDGWIDDFGLHRVQLLYCHLRRPAYDSVARRRRQPRQRTWKPPATQVRRAVHRGVWPVKNSSDDGDCGGWPLENHACLTSPSIGACRDLFTCIYLTYVRA
jgi:hypothetical protein